MEQQRYTLKDINFVAEENYTDINSKIVGFQIENNMVLSMDIADRLSVIINKMLAAGTFGFSCNNEYRNEYQH